MSFTTSISGVIVFGCLVGAGIGLFLSSNWTLANRLAPEAQSGKFLGLTNLATAGSAAVARLQGPAVDYLNSARPGEWIGYRGVFMFGARLHPRKRAVPDQDPAQIMRRTRPVPVIKPGRLAEQVLTRRLARASGRVRETSDAGATFRLLPRRAM